MNRKFIKKLTLLIIFAVLISISTCSLAAKNEETLIASGKVFNPIYSNEKTPELKVELSTGTSTLGNTEPVYKDSKQEIAQEIREALRAHKDSFSVYYSAELGSEDADIIDAFYEDNQNEEVVAKIKTLTENLINEFLELSFEETDNPTEGDYLRYSWDQCNYDGLTIQKEGNIYKFNIPFSFTYYTTKAQETELTTEINKVIEGFGFDENTTDRKKIDTIYAYITNNIAYDYENLENKDYKLKFTAYAALVNKTAVCEGYAVLFYRLAETCGINTRVITGTSNEEAHAWNIVKLDNNYYYVDSTWDAQRSEYEYYLRGMADFNGHTNDDKFNREEFTSVYQIPEIGIEVRTNDLQEGNFKYYTIGGRAFITEYTGNESDVVVPGKLGDVGVYIINSGAINYNENIKTITLSEGICALSSEAIMNLDNLETINYPSTLSIGWVSVTGLTDCPLYCNSLKNITVAKNNQYMKVVDGILYSYDMKAVIQCPPAYSEKVVTLPDEVEIIGNSAFQDCVVIEKIVLPDAMTSIPYWAFWRCSSLKEINIPESCTFIGQYAFSGTAIKKLHIPAKMKFIMPAAFGYYTTIEEITIDPANTQYSVENGLLIDTNENGRIALRYLAGRDETTYTLPEGIVFVEQTAFAGATNLKSIILPDSLKTISNSAFEYCENLEHITLPDGLQHISYGAFYGCYSLASIIIPASVTTIETSPEGFNIFLGGNDCLTIYGAEGSLVQQWAQDNGFSFKNISEFKCYNGHKYERHYELNEPVCKQYRNVCTVCGCKGGLISETYTSIYETQIELNFTSAEYTGKAIEPKVRITYEGKELVENVDYIIKHYDNNINVGFGSVYIEGIGQFAEETSETFEITPKDISGFTPKLEYTVTTYDGWNKTPMVTIDGLEQWIDFEWEHSNNIEVGTAKVIIRGINNYKGTIERTFTIIPQLYPPYLELGLSDGRNDIKLTWGKTQNASGYEIYYKKGNSSSYTKLKTIYGNSTFTYIVKDLNDNTKYDFRIYSLYKLLNGQYVKSNDYTESSIYTLGNLSAPSKMTLSLSGHNNVKLSWSKVLNAKGYEIQYKKSNSSKWSIINISNNSTITYTIKKLSDATKYDFRIYSKGNNTKSSGYKSASIYTLRNLSAPSKVTTNLYGYNDVNISWKKVSNAKGYYIYYKEKSASSYKELGKTTKTSFEKKNLSDGVKYYFKVVPYYVVNSKTYKDDSYKTASIYTLKKVSTPSIKKSSGTKVKVSWSNIDGESGYQISMSTSKKKTSIVSTYSTTSGKSKVIKTKKKKTYYYKVRAYKKVNGKKIYAPWSNVKSYKLK